ncbi:hypothetical protein FTO74_11260 [Granulicella sp. WH15]|uniref:FliM/FliN family flagellar motor switch protein n=1 Tax=Granulicella sp. WH15 TaxID=2602070 RepID=UPI001366FED7|nr:FliM/FliN family flagellar motor switch protein [Granulicella sp. WH15]QHN03886.1 hypothetical protein FTO74_11260 [Granulicella sp. WH15]
MNGIAGAVDSAANGAALVGVEPSSALASFSGGTEGAEQPQEQVPARPVEEQRWQVCSRLPVQLVVTIPLPPLSLKELVELREGQVMLSSWLSRDDVPLLAEEVFLANVSFEPAGSYLGVRISGFQRKSAGAAEMVQLYGKTRGVLAEGDTDADHTLNDIRLPASLCFGSKTMLLHQIMDLTAGDAIVLERAVHAPVNILVGRRIVAFGELISVRGYYGVKLTKLAEPARRLRESQAQF